MKKGIIGILLLLPLLVAGYTSDSYYIPTTSSLFINEHGVYHMVTNSCHLGVFVPTRTAAEWSDFRVNHPSCVQLDLSECNDDSDCSIGQYCIGGHCITVDCLDDSECGLCYRCEGYICVPIEGCSWGEGEAASCECLTDNDCYYSEACIDCICTPVECPSSDYCDTFNCYDCIGGICTYTCGGDDICSAGTCLPPGSCFYTGHCGEGSYCIDGTCVDVQCWSDSDCNSCEYCAGYSCGGGCSDWQYCDGGVCIDIPDNWAIPYP